MPASRLSRRSFLGTAAAVAAASRLRGQGNSRPPNIVVILADDLGYGDLGCYGSLIPTPNIDKLAAEGVKLTKFYSASPVCSPARAALLTGKYAVRSGVCGVLMPDSPIGLGATEQSIPKTLKTQGYQSIAIGKWHLGTSSQTAPNNHFDEFFGIPYSNDMLPLPLMSNRQQMMPNVDNQSLVDRFTTKAVDYINQNAGKPFFLYLAHTCPHIPLNPPARFRGQSGHGIYGDTVMSLDWSVGQVMQALQNNGIDNNTLVVFTSDNGPWYQGSAGELQGRKGSTYEGGIREPMIARLPGVIPAGTVQTGVASMMDLLPTFSKLVGAGIPSGVDGIDIWPMLTGQQPYIDRDALLFFDDWNLQCVRWGPWKLHVARYNSFAWTDDPQGGRVNLPLPRPELYNIDDDPTESYDMAPDKPDLVDRLKNVVTQAMQNLPQQARDAWRDTLARKIRDTPIGALPHTLD